MRCASNHRTVLGLPPTSRCDRCEAVIPASASCDRDQGEQVDTVCVSNGVAVGDDVEFIGGRDRDEAAERRGVRDGRRASEPVGE